MTRFILGNAILGVLVLTAACSDGGTDTPPAGARVALSEWTPLPAARFAGVPAAVQAARNRILGPNATDPAYVKLWWFGVSSFIASAGGHLFLFDAWEIVGLHADYVPIGREELAAIRPEAILVGHGHFDHAADVGYVAGRSGAVVVGSEEICDVAKEDAARDGNENNFRCLITGTMSSPAPGTVQSVRLWADLPEVHILQHLHSAATPEPQDPGTPFIHIPDLLTFLVYLNTDPQETAQFIPTLGDAQGGTWAYHIRVGDFSLLWHDSAGPINDGNPSAAEVQHALDSFPGCVDVQVGAIVGFNQPLSGLRDPRLYVQHAHPRVTLPSHHDAWAPIVGGGAAGYEDAWRAEIATLAHPPQLDFLRDPEDYLKVRAYRVGDPAWSVPMPGSSCAG
jgi:hypothetical protein